MHNSSLRVYPHNSQQLHCPSSGTLQWHPHSRKRYPSSGSGTFSWTAAPLKQTKVPYASSGILLKGGCTLTADGGTLNSKGKTKEEQRSPSNRRSDSSNDILHQNRTAINQNWNSNHTRLRPQLWEAPR